MHPQGSGQSCNHPNHGLHHYNSVRDKREIGGEGTSNVKDTQNTRAWGTDCTMTSLSRLRRLLSLLLLLAAQCLGIPQGAAQTTAGSRPEFADNLSKCVAAERDIDECLGETLEELRGHMHVGIPELNLRKTEPLEIPYLEFNTVQGAVRVNSEFSNVVAKGLSKFETNWIKADTKESTLSVSVDIPRLDITGLYKIKGRVFIFDLVGEGDFVTVLEDVSGTGKANVVPVGPVGDQRLSIQNTDIDFKIGKADVQMNNLFQGDFPFLADKVNEFISEKSGMVIDAVKPQIKKEMVTNLERVLNDAFSKMPADDFVENLHNRKEE